MWSRLAALPVLLGVVFGAGPASAGRAPAVVARVVAVVDDVAILDADVRRLLEGKKITPMAWEQAVQEAIDGVLIDRVARKRRVRATRVEVDRALDEIIRNNRLTEMTLVQELEKQGYTLNSYRAEVERQIVRSRVTRMMVPKADKDKAARAKWLSGLRKQAHIEVRP